MPIALRFGKQASEGESDRRRILESAYPGRSPADHRDSRGGFGSRAVGGGA